MSGKMRFLQKIPKIDRKFDICTLRQNLKSLLRTISLYGAIYLLIPMPIYGADPVQNTPTQEVLVIVKGVTNPFAQFGLIKHLQQIPGVEQATFNLLRGLADIRLKPGAQVTDAEIRQAIRSASYTPGDITWSAAVPHVGNEAALGSGH